jgi:hypothetical protein
MPVDFPKIFENLDNKYLLAEVKSYAQQSHQLHNYNLLVDTSSNQKLYDKYISSKSAAQVNLSSKVQSALDAQAKQKKWSDMAANLKLAKEEVCKDLNDNIKLAIGGKPYLRRAAELLKMGVTTVAVADKAKPHLAAFVAKETPEAQFKAYQALKGIVTKSKLDPVVKLMGQTPPPEPPNAEVEEMLPELRKAIAEGLRYFQAAEENLDTKGVPADNPVLITRMFQSGRMRHEKAHTDYVKGIKLDPEFKTRYEQLVTDKLALDEAWANYRRRLKK